jgi:hypothetical protein
VAAPAHEPGPQRLKRQGGASRHCPLCGVTPRPAPGEVPRNADGTLSRSRTTDGQKAAAGVMTAAQLAEHTALRSGLYRGRVPGVVRASATSPDDPWYAAAPAERAGQVRNADTRGSPAMATKTPAQKLTELRARGFRGPIDQDGNAVMSRTDGHGNPLPLFEGGTGHGTPDERGGKLASSRQAAR